MASPKGATGAPTGLVAAYSFDEGSGTTVADASGNGHTGTITGATWAATGKYGKALQFNGTSALVTVADAASLHLSSGMTLEAWVNPSTVNANWRDVIYKGNDNFYLEATSTNASRPDAGTIAGGSYADAFGTAVLPANSWSHLAETYDGAALRLYVNGTQVASTAHTGTIASSTNPLQIGGDRIYGQFFAGLIDEVRVYNVALTAAQIQTDQATPVNNGPDTQPPSQPGTLTATAVSGGEVDLAWGASSDNVGVSGYQLERCQGSGCSNFVQIATPTGTSYKDTSVSPSTSYSYRVRASDAAGNLSSYSNIVGASTPTPDTQPPSQPGTLTATAVSGGEVDLAWGASSDNVGVSGYQLERCQGSGCSNFVQIATPTGTSYKDTSVSPSTSYSYRVRASDAAGNLSSYSNIVGASTSAAPTGLVAAYSFDEGSGTTVADASGNGHTGTITGATWAATGKYGKALQFNGTSALVTVADAASLHLSSGMTLEAWVNPSTVNANWRDVIYKGNDNFYLEATSTNASRPDAGTIAGGSYADAFGTAVLPANSWSHLAETYDGAALRLYVNGTQVASTAHTGTIASSTNPLQIGGDRIYGQFFAGLIDEVRVYNVALTAAQIQTDQATPVGANLPSAPGALTANTVSASEIDLAWGASSGVSGYQLERCQGSGCSNFVQIATPTGTSYKDTSVSPSTSYSYRVRASDNSGNVGPYSNVATASTAFTVSPGTAVLTFTRTAQFTAQGPGSGGATWSVDDVAGGNASVGTITAGGLYTPPNSVGTHTVTAISGSQTANATVYVSNDPGAFTYHNDTLRTGQDLSETVLTPANVKSATFGKRFSYSLDGLTLASPLYVQNVNISGQGSHNLVIAATEHDSVYAFDADGRSSAPLWHDNFTNPAAGVTTVPAADTGETGDIPNEIGITGTPVIDQATGTIYVVAKTKEVSGGTTSYVQRLHALDLSTGAEKFGGPVVIQASVPGSGNGSAGGTLPFNSLRQNQRTAGLLANGVVYFGFSSHGDVEPFHGWVLGYNASTLQRVLVYCTTPNGDDGGVWMNGDGVATDSTGSLYFISGDGLMDADSGGSDYGDSFIRLSPNGTVQDYFSPSVQTTLDNGNLDLGSGGVLLLPDQSGAHPHEMVSAGKNGSVYLVDRDNMGGYHSGSDQIVQSLTNIFANDLGQEGGNFSSPVYWNGSVYFAPVAGPVQAFALSNGLLTTTPTSKTAQTYNGRGGTMAISANGSNNGILWTLQTSGAGAPGTLHAYNATDLTKELYNSNQAGTRDTLDEWDKFSTPVIANGEVLVTSVSQLTIYGLLP